jgi:oxygen-independent coproporphyrinogen-3 oxidase
MSACAVPSLPPGGDAGFGIYVHWPFCLSKCPYCDFNSHVAEAVDHDAWRKGLLAALEHFARRVPRRRVTSVFFGGGTPSLMPPALVAAVLEATDRLFGLAADVEITLEANPTSSESGRFRDFALAGVNRLSLGIQALSDAALSQLGRRHTAAEARKAWDLARRHFPRVSFDLIYARPQQDLAEWEAELEEALSLEPDHIALYQLTMEPGTPFFERHARGRLALPDEDMAMAMFRHTRARLQAAGLPAYEVSNHARPGEECRHNLLYWRHGPYLGLGPGAHGRLHLDDGTIVATLAHRSPEKWLRTAARGGLAGLEVLSPEAAAMEALLMGLRTSEGLPVERLRARLGAPLPRAFMRELRDLAARGFIVFSEEPSPLLRLTEAGVDVMDHLIERLVPDEWCQPADGA